jgi:hypothetical protein
MNDAIEKVLIPSDAEWQLKATKSIVIPAANVLVAGDAASLAPIRFIAQRPKFYAAFQQFQYQYSQLETRLEWVLHDRTDASEGDQVEAAARLVRTYLTQVLRYDFWHRDTIWPALRTCHIELDHIDRVWRAWGEPYKSSKFPIDVFRAKGQPWQSMDTQFHSMSSSSNTVIAFDRCLSVWRHLSVLARNYEEIVREWFLPTYRSAILS